MTIERSAAAAWVMGAVAVAVGLPAHGAPAWQPVEPMPRARAYHAAATVGNLWYVAGGVSQVGPPEQFPTEVDAYDPGSGQWTVAGQLAQGREFILAISDNSRGQALFVGGLVPAGLHLYQAACELATGSSVSSISSLVLGRSQHAGAYAAGKFIVAGGWGGLGADEKLSDTAEVLDDTASSWRSAGTMPAGPRSSFTMTTLANGTDVVVAGGCEPDHMMKDVDLYNARCGTWSKVASMNVPHCSHSAVLLRDGRVLVAGSINFAQAERSVEIYDPTTGQWALAASMQDARFDHDMVLLPDGRVLVAGGSNNPTAGELGALSSAEVYDPVADTWTATPAMNDRRRRPTLAVLSDGVYVAGGDWSSSGLIGDVTILSSVERLSWADLGIADVVPPPDGGTDGSVEDGSSVGGPTSCGTDGSVQDAASEAATTDGRTDQSARDAATGNRSGGGCSCEVRGRGRRSFGDLAIVWMVVWGICSCRRTARDRRAASRCRPRDERR